MSDRRKKANGPAFLAIGASFLASGVAMSTVNPGGFGLTAVGIVFMILGISSVKRQREENGK